MSNLTKKERRRPPDRADGSGRRACGRACGSGAERWHRSAPAARWLVLAAVARRASCAPHAGRAPRAPADRDRDRRRGARPAAARRLVAIDERGDRQLGLLAARRRRIVRDTNPAVSPDGAWIVFASSRGRRARRDEPVDRAARRRARCPASLTSRRRDRRAPGVDARRRAIVFASTRVGGDFDLWRLAIVAAHARRRAAALTDAPGHEITPSVARDGTIVYARGHPARATARSTVASRRARRTARSARSPPGPGDSTPALSPDGTTHRVLARPDRAHDGRASRLPTRAVDHGRRGRPRRAQIVDLPLTDESGPVWSPDGRYVFATSRAARSRRPHGVLVGDLRRSTTRVAADRTHARGSRRRGRAPDAGDRARPARRRGARTAIPSTFPSWRRSWRRRSWQRSRAAVKAHGPSRGRSAARASRRCGQRCRAVACARAEHRGVGAALSLAADARMIAIPAGQYVAGLDARGARRRVRRLPGDRRASDVARANQLVRSRGGAPRRATLPAFRIDLMPVTQARVRASSWRPAARRRPRWTRRRGRAQGFAAGLRDRGRALRVARRPPAARTRGSSGRARHVAPRPPRTARGAARERGEPRRLPTAAEFEKAARGDNGPVVSVGQRVRRRRGSTARSAAPQRHRRRRQLPDGASPYGVLDLAGNVFEWTSTPWHEGARR